MLHKENRKLKQGRRFILSVELALKSVKSSIFEDLQSLFESSIVIMNDFRERGTYFNT